MQQPPYTPIATGSQNHQPYYESDQSVEMTPVPGTVIADHHQSGNQPIGGIPATATAAPSSIPLGTTQPVVVEPTIVSGAITHRQRLKSSWETRHAHLGVWSLAHALFIALVIGGVTAGHRNWRAIWLIIFGILWFFGFLFHIATNWICGDSAGFEILGPQSNGLTRCQSGAMRRLFTFILYILTFFSGFGIIFSGATLRLWKDTTHEPQMLSAIAAANNGCLVNDPEQMTNQEAWYGLEKGPLSESGWTLEMSGNCSEKRLGYFENRVPFSRRRREIAEVCYDGWYVERSDSDISGNVYESELRGASLVYTGGNYQPAVYPRFTSCSHGLKINIQSRDMTEQELLEALEGEHDDDGVLLYCNEDSYFFLGSRLPESYEDGYRAGNPTVPLCSIVPAAGRYPQLIVLIIFSSSVFGLVTLWIIFEVIHMFVALRPAVDSKLAELDKQVEEQRAFATANPAYSAQAAQQQGLVVVATEVVSTQA